MSTHIPGQDRERELFLRALRAYSERCEAPALTADCPFSHDVSPGQRACLEECLEVLSSHNAPGPVDEIPVGSDITLVPRRPRPRHSNPKTSRPYDAREIYLDDKLSAMPIARWRPAALIEGLRRSIPIVGGDPDALSREQRKDVMAVLKDRGYDVEALIKFGFAYDISGSVGAMLMARHMFSDHVEEIEEFFEGQSENLQRWAHLLGMPEVESRKPGDLRSVSSDHDIVKLLLGRDGPISLLRWVHWANLDDVLEVRAPSSFIFPDHDLGDSETALRALWIRDRFVSTYLRDWHTSSLAMEWRYLFGQCSAPCAPYEMANRHVTPDELAPMLADYAAGQFDQNQRRGELVADRYVPVAKRLLEEGRRADAAAIFEAISTAQPHDGTALNNWGFCLLPDDPERALELLDSASKSSPGRLLIVANRLNALIRLRRFTSALDLAELVLPTIVGSAVEPCMLWSFSAGDELEKCDDVRHYVLNAIDVTLNSVDDASLNEQWAPKLAEVRRSISTLTDAS